MLSLLKYKRFFQKSICLSLIVSCCCVPLFGCVKTDPDYNWINQIELPSENAVFMDGYSSESEFAGIRLVIKDVTPQGAIIHFENDYGTPVSFSASFTLWILDDKDWRCIPFEENVGFTWELVLPYPPPHADRYINFILYFGSLEPGKYRFEEGIHLSHDYDNNDISNLFSVNLYVEFEIN